MNKFGFITSRALKGVVFVLLVLTPIAISFKPYYTPDKPGYPVVFDDPQFLLKTFFIATGLIGGVLTILLVILYFIFARPHPKQQLVLHSSIAICAIALGWHIFPYCVNGIFQVSLGNADFGDFDPHRLIPTIWIGETWFIITVLFYPILIVASFILILMTVIMTLRESLSKTQALQISFFLIITVLSFVILPGYLNWIMD